MSSTSRAERLGRTSFLNLIVDSLLRWQWPTVFFVVLWVFFVLYVLLSTGFISDDAYNSQVLGNVIQTKSTVFRRTLDEITGWVINSGRFYPLNFYHYTLYSVTQNTVLVKLITVSIVAADVVLFGILMMDVTRSRSAGLIAAIFVPVFFQFRAWHDPILAFTFMQPLLFLYMIVSLVFFQKYLLKNLRRYLVCSLIFYTLALLTYEIVYPLFLIFIILAYVESKSMQVTWIKSRGFIALSFLFMGFAVALKTKLNPTFVSGYPGAQTNFDLARVVKTFLIQSYAAFPLSYFFRTKSLFRSELDGLDLLVIGGLLPVVYALLRNKFKEFRAMGAIALGLLLWFVPAFVISVSGHQQNVMDAGHGFGYLPVYFEYFGLCMVLVAALQKLQSRASLNVNRVIAFVGAIVFCAISTINLGQNRLVAKETNSFYKYPRDLLKEALDAGIMRDVPEGAFVIRNMRFPSDYTWFYTMLTGKTFHFCDINFLFDKERCFDFIVDADVRAYLVSIKQGKVGGLDNFRRAKSGESFSVDVSGKNIWTTSYRFDRSHGRFGQVFMAKVSTIDLDPGQIKPLRVMVDRVKIFQKGSKDIETFDLGGQKIAFNQIIATEGEPPFAVGALKSAADLTGFSNQALEVLWSGQFHGLDGTSENNVRWCSGTGNLLLYNFSGQSISVEISMAIRGIYPELSNLEIQAPNWIGKLQVNHTIQNFSKVLSLPPGKSVVSFRSDEKRVAPGDPRQIVFGVFNFRTRILAEVEDQANSGRQRVSQQSGY